MDTLYAVMEPRSFGNYISFKIIKRNIPYRKDVGQFTPYQLIIMDVANQKLYTKIFSTKEHYEDELIEGRNLILFTPTEDNPEMPRDTIPIHQLHEFSSSW